MLILVTCIGFSSCSEEDEILSNPLKGTLWSVKDGVTLFSKEDIIRYIEFIDDKNVNVWDSYNKDVYRGTYSIEGNKVTFHNLYDSYWNWYYVNGTFSSNSLTLAHSYDKGDTKNLYYITYLNK